MAFLPVSLFIDGAWASSTGGRTLEVLNPATSEPLGTVAHASIADLDRALVTVEKGSARSPASRPGISRSNRLPYGLAAYACTSSAKTATYIASAVESGVVSINAHGLALPEVPFGGVKDSGYGSEGGAEAIENYRNAKCVTQTGI